MADEPLIGVLLVDKASGSQIGFIKFDPSGMLIFQIIKPGLHVFAFKPIDHLLSDEWFKEPLYEKHAQLMDKDSKLPQEILIQEASACADFLNSQVNPLKLGGYDVKAQMVHVES